MDILEIFKEKLQKSKLVKNSVTSYYNDAKALMEFVNYKNVNDITSDDIHNFLWQNQPSTAERRLVAIRRFFTVLNECGFTENYPIPQNMKKNMRKTPTKMAPRLSKEEGFIFLQEARKKIRDFAVMMTFINVGLREFELCGVKRADYRNGQIIIRWDTAKGSKERVVDVNEATQKAIDNYLDTRNDDNPYLFISNWGRQYSTSAVRALVIAIAKRAGIEKNITPHALRHTFASQMKSQGVDAYELMELMGHSNIKTTVHYMGRLVDDRKKALVAKSIYNVEF